MDAVQAQTGSANCRSRAEGLRVARLAARSPNQNSSRPAGSSPDGAVPDHSVIAHAMPIRSGAAHRVVDEVSDRLG
jgi:hypothetical protein